MKNTVVTSPNITSNNRETWLNKMAIILCEERLDNAVNLPRPTYRLSMTAPAKKATKKGRVLGSCWNKAASADNTNEIFITAELGESDSKTILSTLTHELIHAYDNNKNEHNSTFAKYCRNAGLEGGRTRRAACTFTATVASDELNEYFDTLIVDFGEIPHAACNADLSGKPTQKNRQLKVSCTNHGCDFHFRASQKMIDALQHDNCLICGDNSLQQETK